MHERGIGSRTPPAVPGVPLAALVARADAIAKRWLIELLDASPLAAVGEMRVADLAADGPAVCAATVEALGSERGLQAALELAPDVARLAAATTPAGAVRAAEALRRAAWAATLEEVPHGEQAVLTAAADRLAHVCAQIAQAATATPADQRGATPRRADDAAPADDDDSVVPLPRPATGEPDFGPLWLAALERQIGAGGRFALLLMELDGADQLRESEDPETLADALERVGRAVRRCIRREDILAHETDGRLWVISPGAGRSGASALARRIATAVERAAALRGAPLTASLGAARFPADARDPAGLSGEAEDGLLAARAAGVRFAGDPGGPDDPDEPAVGPRLVQ
jgi:GGDEF domain-containing protein